MARRGLVAALVPLMLVACGDDGGDEATGGGGETGRVIDVRMAGGSFQPGSITVRAGETITFRLINQDDTIHEFTIGDEQKQAERETMMAGMGDQPMEMDDEPDSVTVQGGDTEELRWTAPGPGTVLYGCHQPGHYAAGEKGTISVS